MPVTQPTKSEVYTLEEAEDHISDVRGIADLLQEHHPLSDSQVPNTPGVGSGSAIYSLSGAAQAITDTGMAGAIPVTSTDTGTQTNTNAAPLATLSAVWAIPANDASAGTMYRLSCWGNGTWGSTQQAMGFGIGFPDATEFGTHQAIAATAFSASAAFRWNCIMWVVCLSPGGSASWHGSCLLTLSETANSINPGAASTNTVSIAQGPSSNVTQDSTVSNNLAFIQNWGSTTGAPTITCHGTHFERIGA